MISSKNYIDSCTTIWNFISKPVCFGTPPGTYVNVFHSHSLLRLMKPKSRVTIKNIYPLKISNNEFYRPNDCPFSLKTMCRTYCAPGSRPPLVVCRRHIPAAVARMASGVLRVPVGLVIDALTVVDGGAGCGRALLLRHGLLLRVTEGPVHGLVVVRADHLPRGPSNATSHRALGGQRRTTVVPITVCTDVR